MPERPRRRKNNRNKRKQNKNNKSDLTDANSSVNDIQTNTDCTNDENSERTQGANSCNLIKDLDKLEDTCSSHQIVPEDGIVGKEAGNSEITRISTCITPFDSSLTENEVALNVDVKNKEFHGDPNTCDNILQFKNENKDSNIIKSECSENTNTGKSITIGGSVLGANQIENNLVDKNAESLNTYLVESPDQQTTNTNKKSKLSNNVKSKSVDNDDSPTIIEVTDEDVNNDSDTSLCVIDSNNVIITDADSDVEWQKTDDFKDSNEIPMTDIIKVLSVSSIPLNVAECNQTNTLKPDDERSLRNFLQTLNLSTNPEDSNTLEIKAEIEHIINREIKHRLRKRALADDFLVQKVGPSRSLTVIDEEGSSESSITSRRQSYLSDKASDNEELDDDVFVTDVSQALKVNKGRHHLNKSVNQFRAIPQECIRVDAKLKEPEITEARGNWTTKTTETLTGAELVYLTDSSSSTSSIYDLNDESDNTGDTDISVRIITPTIEVTDTEKFLTNTHIRNNIDSNINLSDKENNYEKDEYVDSHEIVIKSTDNIATNLFVKELSDDTMPKMVPDGENKIITVNDISPKTVDKYDLEIKVIKCELNDAINNLLKEVSSDSECIQPEDCLPRQDSSSSLGSSQCTAKYNPNHSSLNDVADIINDDHSEVYSKSNHVKEVYEHVIKEKQESTSERLNSIKQPQCLKDFCLKKISSFPFGDKIIEELANVSQRLQHMSIQKSKHNIDTKKVLDLSDRSLQIKRAKLKQGDNLEYQSIPPPVQPRSSSFKITKEEANHELLSRCDPIYKCLSPSNKMLMEQTNTVLSTKKQYQSDFESNKFDHIINTTMNKNVDEHIESYPLKSETGSRLLSLIRDTSLKNNSSSTPYKYNKSENLERISKANFSEPFRNQYSQSSDNYKSSLFDSRTKFASEIFRPIPPPKFRTFSSSFYESDDSSDLTENLLRKMHNEKRYFHYSTGNLSKDIENDVSSIQNMHRHYTNLRDKECEIRPRRPSLPKDLCDKQMEYIRQKEKEVDAEIRRIEQENNSTSKLKRNPRAPMITEESFERRSLSSSYKKPVMKDVHVFRSEKRQISSLFNSSEEELHREKMYSEYVSQMAEREKRREQKIIKITKPSSKESANTISKSMTALDVIDSKANNPIESEFITKARERWNKLGIKDPEPESDKECDVYREPKIIEHKIKVIDAGEEKDVKKLPSHLQEFVSFTVKDKERKNSPGESDPEKTSAHVVILCAVIILMLTVSRYFMRLIRKI